MQKAKSAAAGRPRYLVEVRKSRREGAGLLAAMAKQKQRAGLLVAVLVSGRAG
jgi:hypothetical protein